jgi:hypothetical protein
MIILDRQNIFDGYGNNFVDRFCESQILESHLQNNQVSDRVDFDTRWLVLFN